MREINGWLSPEVMRLAGLALLHFLWQGAALAALAYVAMSMFRSAAARYCIGVAVLALMVAAPPLTYLALQRAQLDATSASALAAAPAASAQAVSATRPNNTPRPASPNLPANSLTWLVEAWFAGVLLCSLRTAGGFLWIEHLRRKNRATVSEAILASCRDLQQRLGLGRMIRFCECVHLQAPAVIGWLRPVVLLPVTALTGLSEAQLRAVIAHELAHIKRLDGFVNLFQIAVETLFFYHPAVWWLSGGVRAEREHCCDDIAVEVCGNPVEYARALARMAEWRMAPALAMAANRSPLAARVARMLGMTQRDGGRTHAGLAASVLCLSAALFAGNAFVGIARTAHAAPSAPQAQSTASDPDKSVEFMVIAAVDQQALPPRPAKPAPAPSPAPEPLSTPTTPPAPQAPQASPSPAKPATSYIDGLKAEGIDNLSVGELVAMKIQGVTPEYVHGIHELGLQPSADDLIAMRVQGVTPAYIQGLRGAGLKPSVDEIIGMKVQGITPEYVKALQALKLETSADDVIGMKVQGVTPEYVEKLRSLGLTIRGDDILGLKVQGVTPEYVRSLQELGLHVDSDDVIGMKVQGVTPEYVKSLRDAGLQADANDLIAAKVQGMTPEFIAEAKSHGFKDLNLDKLISLKRAGVLEK
jgi:beta-lactamase regulating signal transducer with metallopeptidase domain